MSHRRNSERNYPPGRCAQVALAANGLPGVPGEHAECRPRPARRPAPRPARRSPTWAEQPATQPTPRDCCVGVQQADKRGRVPCMPHADERGVISATQSARVLHHCSAQLKCTGEHARSHARNENTHERANKHTNKRTNEQTNKGKHTDVQQTQRHITQQHKTTHTCARLRVFVVRSLPQPFLPTAWPFPSLPRSISHGPWPMGPGPWR